IVELIGTFFLVLTIGMVVIPSADPTSPGVAGNVAPIAIGAILTVMIFAGGHISGAHYNPAVTLAVLVRGRATTPDALGYMAAQAVGALVAGMVVLTLKDYPTVTAGDPNKVRAVLAEVLWTFALCYVVLNVATAKGTAGNSFYGLAIGFTVLAGAYAVGPVSGGAFNPAVAGGLARVGLIKVATLWIYVVGCFAGGALAGLVFNFLNPDDK